MSVLEVVRSVHTPTPRPWPGLARLALFVAGWWVLLSVVARG